MMEKFDVQSELESISSLLVNGCRNHGCVVMKPRGMATNGQCRCTPNIIKQRLERLVLCLKGQYAWPDMKRLEAVSDNR